MSFCLFAYLDPGSGSALVGTLIAIAGSALYSFKSVFYRMLRKDAEPVVSPEIVIFSEGKDYWNSWRLITEELMMKLRSEYQAPIKDGGGRSLRGRLVRITDEFCALGWRGKGGGERWMSR